MLDQIVRWTEITGTAIDVLLLVRILALRLHRTYQFVTLYCAIVVLLDAAGWTFGLASPESERVFVYSRFLMMVVFPLAAWDCFEAVPASLQAFRRPQLVRLISGMLLTMMFALLLAATADSSISSYQVTIEIAMIVWISAAAASLGFVWMMRRLASVQKVALSTNTDTLSIFFLLAFLVEMLSAISLVVPLKNVGQGVEIALSLASAAICCWCMVRLRSEREVAEPSRAVKP